ncbi:hypothetical protein [Streptomyces sp. NPDC012466]|uniref:hypothetical protein n=1 Tax=Streptomyces sp. NPDC012466 TaxID=3364835 RepID=UPI0036ED1DED
MPPGGGRRLGQAPWLRHDMPTEATTALYLLDSATIVVVFRVTVPLVLVTVPLVWLWLWLWLVLVPTEVCLGRRLQAPG